MNPWFDRITMLVILINCVTLGMYRPCEDNDNCTTYRCYVLATIDHIIFAYFAIEMVCLKGIHLFVSKYLKRKNFQIYAAYFNWNNYFQSLLKGGKSSSFLADQNSCTRVLWLSRLSFRYLESP